jgi:hypothetical protein
LEALCAFDAIIESKNDFRQKVVLQVDAQVELLDWLSLTIWQLEAESVTLRSECTAVFGGVPVPPFDLVMQPSENGTWTGHTTVDANMEIKCVILHKNLVQDGIHTLLGSDMRRLALRKEFDFLAFYASDDNTWLNGEGLPPILSLVRDGSSDETDEDEDQDQEDQKADEEFERELEVQQKSCLFFICDLAT